MNERPVPLKPNLPFQLTIEAPGKVGFETHDPQPLGPHEVRIATLYSGISAGTEMTAFLGTSPFLNRHWDPQQRLFVEGEQSWTFPMPAMGYEEVGRVVEVGTGVTKVHEGQVIWGTWRHRSEHVASEDWAAMRVLAPDVDPKLGIFSQIGAIALNAVIDANIHLGEYVAVFGQGVPGLMVTQLARLNGATVIAVDRMASRLEHARELGAAHTIDASQGDVAAQIRGITGGRGADVSIEISGAWPALHEAIRSTAYNSRVIACGFFQGEGQGLRLGEEFHHNRVAIICSQISGLNPGLDHRWDRSRLDRTVMGLIGEGRVDFGRLISHVVPALGAQDAFDMLRERPGECLQVVLDFQG
ncbi:zinc-binding dehydrogenase [Devosia sp. RR2S18]|uniref:zinc-binding dehydrogenase n=1 Tax=Devosia rhizosphaerae TaxID=3049774 RepID=UPI0025400B68|nr:zinc-binding dehydrogenase [Devosia sp. RR2S18]WIJ25833.1 zinc-binding dehydrogenase [Devosia sp. RR2S18]